ncbi:SAM-dependent methyltransferase, type 11 [Desulfonema limicola]|uniref:SAM-dependent methyltransferase, type 11 n=1 Tax=Desulfonema limicola TaxID=45656 RepID=A0A975BAS0_9BACT|nr:methyltransferase domain-containing protein [Desulfonema limicola]QTA81892.1 SAM-dependent methyltransferase, type 11 [Desulfonema limicola]
MKKLNLGSGSFKKKGYINIDISGDNDPDVIHNLEILPYPFANESFDLIEADHCLEHLNDPFSVMKELNRILKYNGKLIIRVPHFSRAMTHPQHKRGFDVTFPLYFDENFSGGYTGTKYICEKVELHWFAQIHLMKKHLPKTTYTSLVVIGKIIDFFANLHSMFCSRIWCYWVGGFYEIEFIFRKY